MSMFVIDAQEQVSFKDGKRNEELLYIVFSYLVFVVLFQSKIKTRLQNVCLFLNGIFAIR